MSDLFSLNWPSLSGTEVFTDLHCTYIDGMANKKSHVSTLYTIALVSYDHLFKRL